MGKYTDNTLQILNILMVASSLNIRKSAIGRIDDKRLSEDGRDNVYGKNNERILSSGVSFETSFQYFLFN